MSKYSAIFVILAAFFWGLSGGIAGVLMGEGWSPFVVAFYRGAIGLLMVALWFCLSPHNSGWANPRMWFWSSIAGLGVAGNLSFYFLSIQHGGISIAATLMYCAPLFVYLVSFALGLEKMTPFKLGGVALITVGVILMTELFSVSTSSISLFAIGAGLLSGACYALFIFGFKYAVRYGTPQAVLTVALLIFSITLLFPSWGDALFLALQSKHWILFVLLGILGAGVSFFLYVEGLKYTAPTIASVVAIIEPVTALFFGFIVLNERLSFLQIVGVLLILTTVLDAIIKVLRLLKRCTRY
jgi:drug/metabolite transporter (DMT)-like permease